MIKKIPADLTSYDVLKTAAIILMVVDHIGVYFYPDMIWFRAIGRFSAPIWLFLIGYANSRDLSLKMWGGALVLQASVIIFGGALFPLNILFSMLFFRMILDRTVRFFELSHVFAIVGVIGLFVLAVPAHFVLEYGMAGFACVLFGYCVRHKHQYLNASLLIGCLLYVMMASLTVEFDRAQLYVVMGGCAAILGGLLFFRPAVFSEFSARCPKLIAGGLQLCGRRSLEIYVIHVVFFRTLSWYFDLNESALLAWSWF